MGLFSKKPVFDSVKVKATLRMAGTRVRMQQNKLVNGVKIQRRQIAELLALQKYESARIRVEQVIRDDVAIEGLEALSLFLDLLANRVQMIAEIKGGNGDAAEARCPPELKECITSVLWASVRLGDVAPELQNIRKYFEIKFGKSFVAMSVDNTEFSVNQTIIDRLGIFTPSNERCLQYLTMIASEYSIEGYDEEKLRDPNTLVASAAAASGAAIIHTTSENNTAAGAAAGGAVASGGTIKTPSGVRIPMLTTPHDELEWRLLQLKRA
ncbi:hypothetical protein TRSC58_02127 [Trypanosoma rangeli SC58]|uniref:Uncharacterized protein n=1 Tax=Trypanosoma rangeli SC58 TaxID=429131 RepID=A0A061J5K2_TRYRA|nr:hypothetical protein TRSC58_02127 [Trypanosoma rangeli SC58]